MDFHEITKRISPKLNAITHKLNGKFLFFNEEDLYQEAMIHLWDKYNKGTLSDKTDSYILQGCFFFLKNYIRKVCKKIDLHSVSLNEIISNEDNTLEDVIFLKDETKGISYSDSKLLREDIYRCLNKKERKILSLSLEGLTTREIGRRFGISHVAVIKIQKRIKDKCKNLFDRQ